ncbi:MAG: hypothetical protein HY827_00155 [Actinobacteria bacterium]|nr:hypothetical protein [Actinomycetota bacterium]
MPADLPADLPAENSAARIDRAAARSRSALTRNAHAIAPYETAIAPDEAVTMRHETVTTPNEAATTRRLWTLALLLAAAGLIARAAWLVHYGSDLLAMRSGAEGAVWVTQAHGYLRGGIVDPAFASLADVYREMNPPGYALFLAGVWKALPVGDVEVRSEYVMTIAFVAQSLLAAATTLMTFALACRVLFGYGALVPPVLLTVSIALVDLPNRFAGDTLTTFMLTATVLLLVKAREADRAAGGPSDEDRSDAVLAASPTAEPPPAARLSPDADLAQPFDAEFIESADDVPARDEDELDTEWAVLDEPPRRGRGRRQKRASREGASTDMLVLLAGLAFSYALITQPRVAIMLPFAAAWLATALPWRFAIRLVLIALLLPAVWIARDYALYDEFIPISLGGVASLYQDNVDPLASGGFVPGATSPRCDRGLLESQEIADHAEWARCMQREGFAELAGHPGRSAHAVGDRAVALLSPWNQVHARGNYDSGEWDYHRLLPAATRDDPTFQRIDDGLAIAWIAVYALLLVLGVISMWAEGPGSAARLMALPLVTLPLVYLVMHAENRSRITILPFIALSLALGMAWVFERRNLQINR